VIRITSPALAPGSWGYTRQAGAGSVLRITEGERVPIVNPREPEPVPEPDKPDDIPDDEGDEGENEEGELDE